MKCCARSMHVAGLVSFIDTLLRGKSSCASYFYMIIIKNISLFISSILHFFIYPLFLASSSSGGLFRIQRFWEILYWSKYKPYFHLKNFQIFISYLSFDKFNQILLDEIKYSFCNWKTFQNKMKLVF